MAKTAPATTQTAPASAKKIDLARPIYREVTAKGYDLGEFKSARRAFIDRVGKELGMSDKAANTYFQNLKSEAETGNLYPYSTSKANATPAPTKAGVQAAEGTVMAQLAQITTGMNRLNRQLREVSKQVAAGAQ